MSKNKINIHISDADFELQNAEVRDTEIRTTGSAFGRFIFTEHPNISIKNNRFINSQITLSESVRNSVIANNFFIITGNAQQVIRPLTCAMG